MRKVLEACRISLPFVLVGRGLLEVRPKRTRIIKCLKSPYLSLQLQASLGKLAITWEEGSSGASYLVIRAHMGLVAYGETQTE